MMEETDPVEKGLLWVGLWETAASAASVTRCDWPQTLQPASHMKLFDIQQEHSL